MYFQHEGAPPHYTRNVREYLNKSSPNHWLGHGGPIAWPPRSPDLTSLDYYLWGRMKTSVYETKVNSRAALRRHIFAVAEHIINRPDDTVCYSVSIDVCRKLHSNWRRTL